MEKLIKKDYPWTVMIEDKLSQKTGKLYQSIGVGFTSVKNKEATDPKEKYETKWFNLFNEEDLLKGAAIFENTYQVLKEAREKDKQADKEEKQAVQEQSQQSYSDLDDDVPFD